jgi:hypothetical protein
VTLAKFQEWIFLMSSCIFMIIEQKEDFKNDKRIK